MHITTALMRAWVITGILVHAITFVSAIYLFTPQVFIEKSPGWSGSRRVPQEVVSVDPNGPAAGKLEVGDSLFSLDGDVNFRASYTPDVKLKEYEPGRQYTLGVLRKHEQFIVPLRLPNHYSLGALPFLLLDLFGSLAFLICAVIMGWNKPDDATARWGWLACLLTSLFYIYLVAELSQAWQLPLIIWAAGMAYPWHLYATYRFVEAFGKTRAESRFWRILRRVIFVLCLIVWIAQFADSRVPWTPWIRSHYPLWLSLSLPSIRLARMLLLAGGLVGLVIRNYRNSQSPAERRRFEIVAGAITIGVACTALASSLSGWTIQGGAWSAVALANLVPMAIPVCFCYAVIAHRVLDIRLAVRRGLRYLLARHVLRLLFFLPLLVMVALALRNPNAPISSMVNLTGLLLVISIALCLEFRERIQAGVDRWFFRERFDREKLLRELLSELSSASSMNEAKAAAQVRLQSLYTSSFVKFFSERSDASVTFFTGSELVYQVCGLDGERLCWLCIGPRKAEIPYSYEDKELIQLVAAQLGLIGDVNRHLRRTADVGQAILAERTRIAMELHDTAGQGFTGIAMYLAAAKKSIEGSPEQASVFLDAARELARSSALETRESLRGIRSSSASAGGAHLEFRLRSLVNLALPDVHPELELDLPNGLCDMASADAGWHLARIAEEAVTNARKHAAAQRIRVMLRREGACLKLEVTDDGLGFEACSASGGFGLQGMRERISHVHGSIEIISSEGRGTLVRALVPVFAESSSERA